MYKVNGLISILVTSFLFMRCVSPLDTINANPQAKIQDHKFYVDGINGSDSNTGMSNENAWKTIQNAANNVTPGDTVIVLSANYPERVTIKQSGENEAPITFRANRNVITQGFTLLADHVTIQGFEITNTPDDPQDGWGIFVNGSYNIIENNYVYFSTRGGITLFIEPGEETTTHNCVVRNNRLYQNALTGIEVSGRDNIIENNEIWGTIQYHPKWNDPPNWVDADGIRFFGSGHTIRKNYIHDISYDIPENVNPHIDCFQTWDDGSYHEQATKIVFEQNLCVNMHTQAPTESGQGFMIEGASDLNIRNNIIQAYRALNAINSNNLTIVHNTLSNSLDLTTANHPSLLSFTQSPNSTIKNNIFYNPLVHSIYFHDSVSQEGLDIGYNDYFRSDGITPEGSPYPNDLWMVDPNFVDPKSGDFHLQADSLLIDAGATLSEISNDYEGNFRPNQNGYDIGAYEFVETYIRNIFYFAYVVNFPY